MGNILWTPKEFKFSNMFSYGEDNLIRFEKAQGIMGIFAPNASGKSSMWDALSFCIYDKASRTNISKNVLNNRKSTFHCKFNFEIDGVDREMAEEAFRNAGHKLPIKTKLVERRPM